MWILITCQPISISLSLFFCCCLFCLFVLFFLVKIYLFQTAKVILTTLLNKNIPKRYSLSVEMQASGLELLDL